MIRVKIKEEKKANELPYHSSILLHVHKFDVHDPIAVRIARLIFYCLYMFLPTRIARAKKASAKLRHFCVAYLSLNFLFIAYQSNMLESISGSRRFNFAVVREQLTPM